MKINVNDFIAKIQYFTETPIMMKGFVPVDIPTKKYIKAWIIFKLGERPVINAAEPFIGRKLADLLLVTTNERRTAFSTRHYTETIRVYIPIRDFKNNNANLNETNVRNLNLFIEALIKDRFHTLMDDLIVLLPNFRSNLPEVRKRLGIEKEAWSYEAMRKDYWRYRIANNKSPEYTKYFTKNITQNVL